MEIQKDPSKRQLTASELSSLGGKARARKLSAEQLSAIGRKGGRPRKKRPEQGTA